MNVNLNILQHSSLILMCCIISAQAQAQTPMIYRGTMDADISYTRPAADCMTAGSVTVPVREHTFIVDQTGEYTIHSLQSGFDAVIFVYDQNVDDTAPLMGCLSGNDDFNGDRSRSEIAAVTLQANVLYNVVTAGFNPNDVGSFTNAIQGPGNVSRPTFIDLAGSTIDQRRFNRPTANCSMLEPGTTNTAYQAQLFSVNVSGDYNITGNYEGFDGYVFIYDEQFNPFNPLIGCVTGDDDGASGITSAEIESVRLSAGRNYYLVTSGFNDNDLGNYTYRITGPGDSLLEAGHYTPSALTGLWFDPGLDGSGFNILSSDVGIIITYYGYIDGEQRWLISELLSDELEPAQQVSVAMLIGDGGQISNPVPGSMLDRFGTLTFRLLDCTTAEATLNGEAAFSTINQDYALTRLLQGTGQACP